MATEQPKRETTPIRLADRQPERAVDFVLRPSKAEQGARQATDKCK